jgi:signal transduction histidine kinase
MPLQAEHANDTDTQRVADLSELLGHVNASWDQERRALARQMHDSLGSSLTALTMHLDLLAQQMPLEPALQQRTAQIRQLLQGIVENNRAMQMTLWNDKLEFLGLGVALTDAADQFSQQHQMAVRCSLPDDDLECAPDHGVALLRALEEGLRNVAAHAQAGSVDVIVDDNDEMLMLTLKDDGIGLQGDPAARLGLHGLRLVRERVRHLGGTLTLTQNPGPGACLTVMLPKSAPPAQRN